MYLFVEYLSYMYGNQTSPWAEPHYPKQRTVDSNSEVVLSVIPLGRAMIPRVIVTQFLTGIRDYKVHTKLYM